MNKLRYGIIGCGSMGREHIENIRAMGGAVVTAVADPTAASREQASALLEGQVQLFERHADLLGSGLCDAVVVASPNFTHVQVMRDALATDLHILIEKPLVTKVADGIDLLERARAKRHGIVWVAQEYRYMPPVAEMIRIAHEGGVGRIHQVAIREHRDPFYPKVGDWNRFNRQHRRHPGREVLPLLRPDGLHPERTPQRASSPPAASASTTSTRSYDGKTPDILDSAFVIVEYPSGARASSTCACSPRTRSTTSRS